MSDSSVSRLPLGAGEVNGCARFRPARGGGRGAGIYRTRDRNRLPCRRLASSISGTGLPVKRAPALLSFWARPAGGRSRLERWCPEIPDQTRNFGRAAAGRKGGENDRIGEYRAAIGGAGVMTKNVLKLQHFQITGHPGRKIRKLWLIRALAGTLRFVIQHTTG